MHAKLVAPPPPRVGVPEPRLRWRPPVTGTGLLEALLADSGRCAVGCTWGPDPREAIARGRERLARLELHAGPGRSSPIYKSTYSGERRRIRSAGRPLRGPDTAEERTAATATGSLLAVEERSESAAHSNPALHI
ncbi:hypothetical protein NDU88_005559 [Pleurodeles waltl]|uniref:Uncharacterized protein n=1 Tax=Pleurodeles waltl TaxID=8319 RepID=A0AAV7SLY8_PLEWA|nr:hypothetical protein NDU88_005559 [Pleurodeles waltl]